MPGTHTQCPITINPSVCSVHCTALLYTRLQLVARASTSDVHVADIFLLKLRPLALVCHHFTHGAPVMCPLYLLHADWCFTKKGSVRCRSEAMSFDFPDHSEIDPENPAASFDTCPAVAST